MIVHFFPDGKFLKLFHDRYRKNLGDEDIFYIYRRDKKFEKIQGVNTFYDSELSFLARIKKIISLLVGAERVILHSLFLDKYLYLLLSLFSAKYGGKCAWVVWGGDLGDLYKKEQIDKSIRTQIRACLRKRIIGNLGYVITSTNDCDEIKKCYETKDLKERYGYYFYPVFSRDKNIEQNYIMVGHSAHPGSRHIETYRMLANLDISVDDIVYSNLSYGYTPELHQDYKNTYISEVENEGIRLFKDRYCPDHEFCSYNEYMNKLMRVRVAIFNNSRGQGFSNIANMLAFGTKIYMHPDNGLYDVFTKIGAVIYPIEELDKYALMGLDKQIKEHNKKVIEDYFSDEAFVQVWYKAMHE